MLRYSEIYNVAVFVPKEGKTRVGEDGEPHQVYSKIGRMRHAVFTPDGRRLVGILVKRPDVAGMIKRDEVFVATDSFERAGKGLHVTGGKESFDAAARARLGIDWERCVMWTGMDAITTEGKALGYVNDAEFEERSGVVSKFFVGDDGMARQLVGSFEIPAEMVRGYNKGRMVVDPAASSLKLNGGLAARAGEATGKVMVGAQQAGEKVAKGAADALDRGTHDLGRMISDTKRAYQQEAGTAKKGTGAAGFGKPDAAASASSATPAAASKKSAASPKKKASSSTSGEKAARAVGRQLGKFGSMFGSFADEYKKSSR